MNTARMKLIKQQRRSKDGEDLLHYFVCFFAPIQEDLNRMGTILFMACFKNRKPLYYFKRNMLMRATNVIIVYLLNNHLLAPE